MQSFGYQTVQDPSSVLVFILLTSRCGSLSRKINLLTHGRFSDSYFKDFFFYWRISNKKFCKVMFRYGLHNDMGKGQKTKASSHGLRAFYVFHN